MAHFFPVFSIWLAIVAIGLLAVFVARYFVGGDKDSMAGFYATIGIAIGNSAALQRSPLDWWVDLIGVTAGLATLWWYLFKRKEFGRG